MKKFAIVLALLLLAAPALAVTGTITWTDGQNTRFDRDRVKLNTVVCVAQGLAAGCTQNQARAAFCARPGSSSPTAPCVVGGQASGDVVIYADVAEYLDKYVITSFFFPNLRQSQQREDKDAYNAWLATASQAQKDAACLAAGLAAGCM